MADVGVDSGGGPVECEICGDEPPADLLEETTVATIAPMRATLCTVCQLVQDHTLPDDVCMECGDELDERFYIEIEYPCGVADLPARLAGNLCGDCAEVIGSQINYRGVQADDEAAQRFADLVDEQTDRRNDCKSEAAQ